MPTPAKGPAPGRRAAAAAPAPRRTARAPRRSSGFTLIELLVVLVVVGLLYALVAPNLGALRDSLVGTTERDHILDQFAALGALANARGQAYVVYGNDAAPDVPPPDGDYERYRLDIPEGWQVRLSRPLLIRATGVCLGSELTVRRGEEEPLRVDLAPPFCRVDADA